MDSILEDSRWQKEELGPAELARYARHITIPDVGSSGQKKLRAARVLCIGAGGLGSPVALYLAAAGVGKIGIVDEDEVELSNLQRQIIHGTGDVGRKKVDSAEDRLRKVNPCIEVETFQSRFRSENAKKIAENYDLIIDGTDNFPTRYLSNDTAVLLQKPNVYGSIYRFEGQVAVFAPHLGGPCYRCLFPRPPTPGQVPSCAEGGVLGVLPGIVGCLQANEAIKLILGIGEPLVGRLVHFDALAFRFREIRLRPNPDCEICGAEPSITELRPISFACAADSGSAEVFRGAGREIDVRDLRERMERNDAFLLLDVREPEEAEICRLPGSRLIPLGQLAHAVDDLDPTQEIIVHCKSGGRSLRALTILAEEGFENICHVRGGINAWSREIDPKVPLY